jgi:hypothetical protein
LEMAKRPRTQKQIDGLRAGAARANAKRHKEALARRCG